MIVAKWRPMTLPRRVNSSATIGKLLLLLFSGTRCEVYYSGMSSFRHCSGVENLHELIAWNVQRLDAARAAQAQAEAGQIAASAEALKCARTEQTRGGRGPGG